MAKKDEKEQKQADTTQADNGQNEPQNTDSAEDYKNKYLRALADYQNLEKRMHNSVVQARQQAKKDVILQFLDVVDDLEKAEVFVQDPGLKMIMDRFHRILDSAGVEELELEGTEFDPYTADAVAIEEGEKDDIITEVIRKGYKLGDEVIRPAQVKVSKTHAN